jgi:XTP/dITP diphosphohydrolase
MLNLIFASNNSNKVEEIRGKISGRIHVITLADAGIDIDIPEPYDTLEENAHEKSRTIYALTGEYCFSEDTGLEVEALGGAPGVRSARYAGDHKNSADNIKKLLFEMENVSARSARFRTVISLQWGGKEYLFEGICEGSIATEQKGNAGFGYDPVFIPAGSNRCFAEMTIEEKADISHRSKAVAQMAQFLNSKII